MPDLSTQLDALRAVAAHGTMTGAAAALYLPRERVADEVADLANALDVNLLDVVADRLVPTTCGRWGLAGGCARLGGSAPATVIGSDDGAPPCATDVGLPCVGPHAPGTLPAR